MYCAWRIPAHLRCTQCSILLHLMDICFLTCICLWQISHIQTRLFSVVGPGLVSTSPAFVSSSASHPAGPHAQKTENRAPIAGGGLIILIRDNITFTTTAIPSTINTHNTLPQMVKVHINSTIYIHPRDNTCTYYKIVDTDIQHCIQNITHHS